MVVPAGPRSTTTLTFVRDARASLRPSLVSFTRTLRPRPFFRLNVRVASVRTLSFAFVLASRRRGPAIA